MLFLGTEKRDCLPTLSVLGFFSGLEATLSESSSDFLLKIIMKFNKKFILNYIDGEI